MNHSRASVLVRWVIILAMIGAAGVGGWQATVRLLRPRVTVTHPVQRRIVQAFYATGTLQPDREYPIKSNNPGVLTEVKVDKGGKVKSGDELAVVREDGIEFKFAQAKADRDLAARLAVGDSPIFKDFDARLAASREILKLAEREQSRLREAVQRNAASQSDLDKALDRVKTVGADISSTEQQRAARKLELEKNLEVAEAGLRIATWNLDRQTVRCPIDHGTVLDRPISAGTRLAVNDHIMQIADVRPENLVMKAAVDEEDKTKVSLGQKVKMTLYAYPNRAFEGRVSRIYDQADPIRRTFEIDVSVDEKDRDSGFAPGMTGELAFIQQEKESGLVIPSQAVQHERVWIVRDGQVMQADVRLGISSVERREVLSGLTEDDVVVISPADKLKAGQRVRTEDMDPDTAAGQNKPKQAENVFRGFK